MINIVAFIHPKPELYSQCLAKVTAILAPTKEEAGCIKFELFEQQNTGKFVLIETFRDQTALDLHYQQPYVISVFEFYESALLHVPEIHKLTAVEG
ncbi:putative quinol monooxygenase [Paraglaciecola sp.]|uniref:putative quinol monooxygenase n=1 Tax=Paraglaciecola sp. TaxID=1920173 RepID=UPI0030F4812A